MKRTEPSIPLTDPRFKYTHSTVTDIAKRFKEVQAKQQAPNVQPIKRKA